MPALAQGLVGAIGERALDFFDVDTDIKLELEPNESDLFFTTNKLKVQHNGNYLT